MLAVLAAFFCLLFFAAAKKSRCRPAQGRRLNGKHRNADASASAQKPNRTRRKGAKFKPTHHEQTYAPTRPESTAAAATPHPARKFPAAIRHGHRTIGKR